jgi:hypothetical protein
MLEHHLLDLHAVDLRKPVGQSLELAFIAKHLQEDQTPRRADLLVDVVQPDAGFDVTAIFGERLLDELNVADAIVDVDAENHVFGLHGTPFQEKEKWTVLPLR